jgi:large subunit ribosomal protein L22
MLTSDSTFSIWLRKDILPYQIQKKSLCRSSNEYKSSQKYTRSPDVNEIRAVSKGVPISQSKINRVLRTIRGKSYFEALTILKFIPYQAGSSIINVVRSAGANAKHNFGVDERDLIIKTAIANQGRIGKRARPRARGRAFRIMKLSSHITIKVTKMDY